MIDQQLSPARLPPPVRPSCGRDRGLGRTVLLVLALLALSAGAVAGAVAVTSDGLHHLASVAGRSAQSAPAHPRRPQPRVPQVLPPAVGASTGPGRSSPADRVVLAGEGPTMCPGGVRTS